MTTDTEQAPLLSRLPRAVKFLLAVAVAATSISLTISLLGSIREDMMDMYAEDYLDSNPGKTTATNVYEVPWTTDDKFCLQTITSGGDPTFYGIYAVVDGKPMRTSTNKGACPSK